MDYSLSFQSRAHAYVDAVQRYPSAFEEEFRIAVEMLDIQSTDILVTIPSGGVYIDSFIPTTVKNLRFEIQEAFSNIDNVPLCTLQSIPCDSSSVTKILTLACLHHTTNTERIAFYNECFRILQPNGLLVIGDVLCGSEQDVWLNTIVNAYNSKGHCGTFFTEEDVGIIESCGFDVTPILKTYRWNFSSDTDMILFFKQLMNLDLLEDLNVLKELLYKTFKIVNSCVDWKLLYFVCKKH
jgi:SAM-dependent methyltransferase